ncbi:MAG: hypothetical protein KatS3mg058_3430 [Roseiflexus sp.]|nr:MAG: hypothetical protein KatS3mg058_3430 [Roseiflexus sp.]
MAKQDEQDQRSAREHRLPRVIAQRQRHPEDQRRNQRLCQQVCHFADGIGAQDWRREGIDRRCVERRCSARIGAPEQQPQDGDGQALQQRRACLHQQRQRRAVGAGQQDNRQQRQVPAGQVRLRSGAGAARESFSKKDRAACHICQVVDVQPQIAGLRIGVKHSRHTNEPRNRRQPCGGYGVRSWLGCAQCRFDKRNQRIGDPYPHRNGWGKHGCIRASHCNHPGSEQRDGRHHAGGSARRVAQGRAGAPCQRIHACQRQRQPARHHPCRTIRRRLCRSRHNTKDGQPQDARIGRSNQARGLERHAQVAGRVGARQDGIHPPLRGDVQCDR